ncbi:MULTISPECIES: TetR/AcrR family transcriptional regulator [Dyadobacter]|uniref:TetR/AcrR family transcriptional regulator n=1 Tax=Dyadobacter chenhuakuii TaxID=2909339 RepID=A0A9X1QD01_9BACT|nr:MULTISPECIES: TetR/AcrR family transcriptional regulator [Dyadobacter]MCE7073312.1 TetR/AcrR family transcriptional regulator [Dyadobacter sp. CY327]MCF2499588.1 TetR/AcrR family transcriptional regulator [Dyadobacter chenhuakuii]
MARTKAFEPVEKLERAKDIFWQKGYQATSMQDLVDTMGLNRGSIYDTYGDKHSLFLMCLKSYSDGMLNDYLQATDAAKSPVKAIEKIIKRAAARTIEEGKTCMGVKSAFELASDDEEVHAILKENTGSVVNVLKDLIRKAQKADEINAKRDPAVLANFIVSNFTGFWQLFLVYGDPEMLKQQADFLIRSIKK